MDVSKKCLKSEMTVAKNVIQNIGLEVDINLKDVIQVLSNNKSVFPNLYKSFKITLTILISSAIVCERSFLAMRKIKT